jgi:polar amino acid transport system substrate-binding protein
MFFDEASVNTFRSVELAEEQLVEGRAHVYLAGMSEARFLALKNPDIVDIPVGEPLVAQSEGLAVRKGEQELLNFLNTWVTARQTDKWLPTTRAYWFDTMTWAMDDE